MRAIRGSQYAASRRRARWPISLICGLGVCWGSLAEHLRAGLSAEGENRQGSSWAVLMGIEKYHRAPRLRFAVNDVKQISSTLRQRGSWPEDHILELVDTAPNSRFQPLRSSVLAELPQWLAKATPQDQVLVYFSGHGFRDRHGKLYLATVDTDPANLLSTSIEVQWLRAQIAACKAHFKLLILDTCHAGEEKGTDETPSVAAKDFGMFFEDLTGVVTLASSTTNEVSQVWDDMEQSLFSYWLNQGLKGHADLDGDGAVTIDELYSYVYRNVTQTSHMYFPHPQTPVRIVRSGTLGVPVVIRLQPQTLKQVLADMADQLATTMKLQRFVRMGILEFTNDTKLGELLGADFGLLGHYCAEEMEHGLMNLSGGRFRIVDRRYLQNALRDAQFGIKDLGSTAAFRRLAQNVSGMPIVALGTLRNRAGRLVTLQCKLLRTDNNDLAGEAGGTAALNDSEWAMLGRSATLHAEAASPPALPAEDSSGHLVSASLIDRLDRRSQGPHPLADAAFPFPVRIFVGTQERKGVFRGNDLFVPLRAGEVYQIHVENRTGQVAIMRLLVDGLNTLPEKVLSPGATGDATDQPAQRVNLSEAQWWVLDVESRSVYAVRGFFTSIGRDMTYREFKVVDAQQSLAARQQFTEQIGLITAAFYSVREGSSAARTTGGIGTGFGEERTEKGRYYTGAALGDLLAVVHIRYVEPEVLQSPAKP